MTKSKYTIPCDYYRFWIGHLCCRKSNQPDARLIKCKRKSKINAFNEPLYLFMDWRMHEIDVWQSILVPMWKKEREARGVYTLSSILYLPSKEPRKSSQSCSNATLDEELFKRVVKSHKIFTLLIRHNVIVKNIPRALHSDVEEMTGNTPCAENERVGYPIRKEITMLTVALIFLISSSRGHGKSKAFHFMRSCRDILPVIFRSQSSLGDLADCDAPSQWQWRKEY